MEFLGVFLFLLIFGPLAVVGLVVGFFAKHPIHGYFLAFSVGAFCFIYSVSQGGVHLGPFQMNFHRNLWIEGLPELPLNLVWCGLAILISVKSGRALREGWLGALPHSQRCRK